MSEQRKPETITGRGLAAFLSGLFPGTDQFERQIRWVEEEARTGLFWPGSGSDGVSNDADKAPDRVQDA